MPKVKFYTPSELTEFSTKDLLKIVQREAERVNKQITRYNKRGEQAGDVIPSAALERIKIAQLKYMTRVQLKHAYSEMHSRVAGGDLSIRGIAAARKKKKEIMEREGLDPEDVNAEEYQKLHKIIEEAGHEAAVFYDVLTMAVETGVERSTQFFRTTSEEMTELTKTEEGRAQFMVETMERINKKIKKDNAQARRFNTIAAKKGKTERKELEELYDARVQEQRIRGRLGEKYGYKRK